MASINLQSKDSVDDGARSPARSRGVSSPWSKIVSGNTGELSPPVVSVAVPAASPPPIQEQIVNASSDWFPPDKARSPDDPGTECQPTDGSDDGGGNAVKKPVWSKPVNGVVKAVSPVMGADSWPALGEVTKAAPKSSLSEPLQAVSDGSLLPAIQVTGNSSPLSHKPATVNNTNPSSTPNHITPSVQRSVKRVGGISGTYSQRSPANHDSKVEIPVNTVTKPGPAAIDSHPKDHTHKESPRTSFGSQLNSGSNSDHHHHQRNPYRRGNGGQHGSYNHNYGGKMEQNRGNKNRNFNNNMQPQRGYVQPSVYNTTPFINPSMHAPVHPFGNNVMYPDAMNMVYGQGPVSPMVPQMPGPMFFYVDPVLHVEIVKQIDYYFSNENLVKDTFLRKKMDEQGWVPVKLIAGFKKVSSLTDNVQLILNVMRTSTVVEVQDDKIRRRNDWMRWLMPAPAQYSRSNSQDSLNSQFQGIVLVDDVASKKQENLQQGGYERAAVA